MKKLFGAVIWIFGNSSCRTISIWIFGFILHQYTGLNMTGSLYEVDDYGRGSFMQLKNLILLSFENIDIVFPTLKYFHPNIQL